MTKLTIEDVEKVVRFYADNPNADLVDGREPEVYRQLLDTLRENERLREALQAIGGEMIYRRDKERDAFFPMLEAWARITEALHPNKNWAMENGTKVGFAENGEEKWTSLNDLIYSNNYEPPEGIGALLAKPAGTPDTE